MSSQYMIKNKVTGESLGLYDFKGEAYEALRNMKSQHQLIIVRINYK